MRRSILICAFVFAGCARGEKAHSRANVDSTLASNARDTLYADSAALADSIASEDYDPPCIASKIGLPCR